MLFRTVSSVFTSRTRIAPRRPAARRLRLEPLDDRALPSGYVQANLASDVPGQAQIHDRELVDAWGISIGLTGTFWVSGAATDVSTVYRGDVTPPSGTFAPFIKSPLTVTIEGGKPTGQVNNGSGNFVVSGGGVSRPAAFIFATDTGDIVGWSAAVPTGPTPPSRVSHVMATTPGAVYTGLAIDSRSAGTRLYAADFKNGEIDVFNSTYTPITPSGDFVDPDLPANYSPFNIWELGGKLYVAYAQQIDGDAHPDGGHGFVSTFDFNGNFLDRVVSDPHLKEPWGMAIAPANFGEFSNALLVAEHGTGKIDAFDPTTGEFLGRLADENGEAIHIAGLMALHFGNGISSGDLNALYFTAAGKKHDHGLFGSLRVNPDAPAAAGRMAVESGLETTGKVMDELGLVSALSGIDAIWTGESGRVELVASEPEARESVEAPELTAPAGPGTELESDKPDDLGDLGPGSDLSMDIKL